METRDYWCMSTCHWDLLRITYLVKFSLPVSFVFKFQCWYLALTCLITELSQELDSLIRIMKMDKKKNPSHVTRKYTTIKLNLILLSETIMYYHKSWSNDRSCKSIKKKKEEKRTSWSWMDFLFFASHFFLSKYTIIRHKLIYAKMMWCLSFGIQNPLAYIYKSNSIKKESPSKEQSIISHELVHRLRFPYFPSKQQLETWLMTGNYGVQWSM